MAHGASCPRTAPPGARRESTPLKYRTADGLLELPEAQLVVRARLVVRDERLLRVSLDLEQLEQAGASLLETERGDVLDPLDLDQVLAAVQRHRLAGRDVGSVALGHVGSRLPFGWAQQRLGGVALGFGLGDARQLVVVDEERYAGEAADRMVAADTLVFDAGRHIARPLRLREIDPAFRRDEILLRQLNVRAKLQTLSGELVERFRERPIEKVAADEKWRPRGLGKPRRHLRNRHRDCGTAHVGL